MNKEEIYNYIKNNLEISDVKIDEPMNKHTSFKIGGLADVFVVANDIEEIRKVLQFCSQNNINLFIIGNGSNLLVKDNGIRGIVLKVNLKDINIESAKNGSDNEVNVTVGAGTLLGALAQNLLKSNISGFEFASGIPGTIGGAIRMNAGAYGGEFKDIVVSTKCLDYEGNEITLSNEEQKFSYRNSVFSSKKLIIIETILKLKQEKSNEQIQKKMNENMESRKQKQPINYPSAGSTFKRGEDFITAKLIDECGLKGYTIGGAQVSEKHAGFIVNVRNATANDVINLISYVKETVLKKCGKEIKLEIEIVGE